MSDRTYEYVECNGCGAEARKESRGMMQQILMSPDGWIAVVNRDGGKLWDICPGCAKAFTTWLLQRAGIMPKDEGSQANPGIDAFVKAFQ